MFLQKRLLLVLSVWVFGGMSAAHACSTCRCGDPTITLLGSEKAFSGRTRLGLDLLWRSETDGPAGLRRKTDEQRSSFGLAYSLNDKITLALQAPFVSKTLRLPNREQQEARGWGDTSLSLRAVLWRKGPMSGRHLAGLRAGLRLPTAESLRDDNGVKLDIDAQPDAGVSARQIGGWYAYHRHPWFISASSIYSDYSQGRQEFAPGNSINSSVFAQYAPNSRLGLVLGLDLRHAQADRVQKLRDENSGGALLMGRTGLALRLGDELVASLLWQGTLLDKLNGDQTESAYLRLSVAYDL